MGFPGSPVKTDKVVVIFQLLKELPDQDLPQAQSASGEGSLAFSALPSGMF